MMHLTLLLAILLAAAVPARADELDLLMEERMAALRLPGLSLAVVRDGRVVEARGWGFADVQNRVPATPETVWEIGSNTKQFTAVAVLLLAEDGRLGLDDPLTRYFPEGPEWWGRITLRHLLHHTGGIQNHVAVPGYMDTFCFGLTWDGRPGPDELLARFRQLPREFDAGETWSYDNTGYVLLGRVVEKASGVSYWDFLQQRVLAPAGMTASRSSDPRAIVPRRASGYAWTGTAFENRPPLAPFVASSAGSLLSTVLDLARWVEALSGDRLLRPESRAALVEAAAGKDHALLPFGYGLGVFVDAWRGHRVVQHTGGTPGFSSAVYRFPDDGLAVVLAANRADIPTDAIAIDVAGLFDPDLRRPAAADDPDPATTARHREVLSGLMAGRPALAAFTRPLQVFLGTATGNGFYRWFADLGALQSFAFREEETAGGDSVRRYAVGIGATRHWFSVRTAPDGRIAQVTPW